MRVEDVLQPGSRICVDSNILIYLVEGDAPARDAVFTLWSLLIKRAIGVVASEIAVGECLIGVERRGLKPVADIYAHLFFGSREITLWPVDLTLICNAARIGGQNRVKLLDAVHLETARASGCAAFVTNDVQLRSIDGLSVLHLSQFTDDTA